MAKRAKANHRAMIKHTPTSRGFLGESFSLYPMRFGLPMPFGGWPDIFRPEVDVYETAKDVVVKASVAGCDKKDIKVHLSHNILTIHGEKKEDKEVKRKDFYQKEHRYGSFSRSVVLPHHINAAKAQASCEKGMLKIVFPKVKSSRVVTRDIALK